MVALGVSKGLKAIIVGTFVFFFFRTFFRLPKFEYFGSPGNEQVRRPLTSEVEVQVYMYLDLQTHQNHGLHLKIMGIFWVNWRSRQYRVDRGTL